MRGKAGLFARAPQPFDPSSIAGLTGWWDASDSATLFDAVSGGSATASDGAVARFEDKSGLAQHWTQGTTAACPIRKVATRNSLDVIRFDGSDDVMRASWLMSDILASGQGTVFVVASASAISTNNAIYNNAMVLGDEGGSNGFYVPRSNGTVAAYGYDGGFVEPSVSYSQNNWIVLSTTHASGQLSVRKNGGSPSIGTSLFTRSDFSYAAVFGANFSLEYFFDGDVGEMLTYNVSVSSGDREMVESYLMSKWAIT